MEANDCLYDEKNSVNTPEVDSRRLILYDYPVTLNQNGIYNILENIGCPPTNILLMEYCKLANGSSSNSSIQSTNGPGEEGDQSLSYVVSSKTGSWAIVEFSCIDHVNKAFYVLTTKHQKYFDAQYAYCCR